MYKETVWERTRQNETESSALVHKRGTIGARTKPEIDLRVFGPGELECPPGEKVDPRNL